MQAGVLKRYSKRKILEYNAMLRVVVDEHLEAVCPNTVPSRDALCNTLNLAESHDNLAKVCYDPCQDPKQRTFGD